MRRLLGLTLLFCLAAPGHAQDFRGGYIGAMLGSFSYEESDDVGVLISDRAGSYRLLGGYHFNSNYALEVGYGTTDELSETYRGFDQAGDPATVKIGGEFEIASLRVLMLAPFSSIGMFGGLGYYDATFESSFRYRSPTEEVTYTEEVADDGFTVVGGIVFDFDRFSVRGEYEWFDTDGDVDATNLGVSVVFRF